MRIRIVYSAEVLKGWEAHRHPRDNAGRFTRGIQSLLGEGYRSGAGAVVDVQGPQHADAVSARIFGRALSTQELASLVGAGAGDMVAVQPVGDLLMILVRGTEPKWKAERTVTRDAAGRVIIGEAISAVERRKGLGTSIFASQVVNATKLGVAEIRCFASQSSPGGSGTFNGGYTWARLGFEPVNPKSSPVLTAWRTSEPARRAMGSAGYTEESTLRDLLATAEGRAIWAIHAVSFDAVFKLAADGYSVRALHAYLEERSGEED